MTDLAETIGLLRAAFPRQDFPRQRAGVHARPRDLEPQQVRAAVLALAYRVDWLPSIASIRREVAVQTLGLPDETQAWLMVQAPIGRAGAPPPVKAAVEALGGPYALRTGSLEHLERRFRKAYGELREAEIRAFAESRPQSMIGTQTRELGVSSPRSPHGPPNPPIGATVVAPTTAVAGLDHQAGRR